MNTFTVTTQMLSTGLNMIYVRMKSSAACVTTTTAADSFAIRLNVTTAPRSGLEEALKLFPNPNDGLFSFRFETGIDDEVSVTMYNAGGKIVYASAFGHVSQYYFSKTINLRNQAKGTYIVQLKVGKEVITRRINITR